MINDAKCAREIKSKIGIAKAAFNKKTVFFPFFFFFSHHQQTGLTFQEETFKALRLKQHFVWS
jgi:hypothetical protein